MIINVWRIKSNALSTRGDVDVDGQYVCVSLEDAYHSPKIPCSTRISAGKYRVVARREGGFYERYRKRFGLDWHPFMLWIADVPEFEYILFHCGNTIGDTDGCVLVGSRALQPTSEAAWEIRESEDAYRHFYPIVRDALLRGEEVWANVVDKDRTDGPLVS